MARFTACDRRLVAPVENPLLDPLRPDQPRPGPRIRICSLTVGWLTPSFSAMRTAADAVADEVAVDLWPEMRTGIARPIYQDLQTPVVGERPYGMNDRRLLPISQ